MSNNRTDEARVIDIVKTYGPGSASDLAEKMGCNATSAALRLFYLQRLGLIQATPGWNPKSRKECWIYFVPGYGYAPARIDRNSDAAAETLSLKGVDQEHLDWMASVRESAQRRQEQRQRRRHAG